MNVLEVNHVLTDLLLWTWEFGRFEKMNVLEFELIRTDQMCQILFNFFFTFLFSEWLINGIFSIHFSRKRSGLEFIMIQTEHRNFQNYGILEFDYPEGFWTEWLNSWSFSTNDKCTYVYAYTHEHSIHELK